MKDANAWATETAHDARYPLSLLLRVITVSVATTKLVHALPALDILDEPAVRDRGDIPVEPAVGDRGDLPGEPAVRERGKIVPFRRVTPMPDERYTTCVPLVGLQLAAGPWSAEQESVPELDGPDVEWVTWDSARRFTKDMFVARVTGRSMEPAIPDGAYCLFRLASLPSSPDRIVLARHGGAADPETGGQYTVKRYREEKGANDEKRIILQPANAEFAPIVLAPPEVDGVRVIAEVVEVLSHSKTDRAGSPAAHP